MEKFLEIGGYGAYCEQAFMVQWQRNLNNEFFAQRSVRANRFPTRILYWEHRKQESTASGHPVYRKHNVRNSHSSVGSEEERRDTNSILALGTTEA